MHPTPKANARHRWRLPEIILGLPGDTRLHVFCPPSRSSIVTPLHSKMLWVMLLHPIKCPSELAHVHLEKCPACSPVSARPWTNHDEWRIRRHDWQARKESGHTLPKVAYVPHIRELACPRQRIHLNKRMYQSEHHLFMICQRGHLRTPAPRSRCLPGAAGLRRPACAPPRWRCPPM